MPFEFESVNEVYAEFFASVEAGLVLELSHQGQLYRILRMHVDVPKGVVPFARSGANPFRPSEVLARLESLAKAGSTACAASGRKGA